MSSHLLLSVFLDVYSFEEEEAVLDPHVAKHLAHFGIDMLQMQGVGNTFALQSHFSTRGGGGGGRDGTGRTLYPQKMGFLKLVYV